VPDPRPASPAPGPAALLPSAFDALPRVAEAAASKRLAVFLDYDGTLTPIAATPELAVLGDHTREVVRRLAAVVSVAVVSGRDLADLVERVALPGIAYAGSHGLEVQHADGARSTVPGASAYLDALARAGDLLEARLREVPGARVERKRFALAAHFRLTPDVRVDEVRAAVAAVAGAVRGLRITGGKRVLELRPDLDWHKGRAVRALADALSSHAPSLPPYPVYLGDDVTDEDAFREVASDGLGVVVGEPQQTAARAHMESVVEVVRWLEALTERIEAPSA